MCAQFIVQTEPKEVESGFDVEVFLNETSPLIGARILPFGKGMVVRKSKAKRQLDPMQFSLLPAWSSEKRVKFPTHNARLESWDEKNKKVVWIYEKPTWRDPFKSRHCLIPMTDFIEPIYIKEFAGNMVRFFPKSGEILAAAGIWEQWISKKDGEVIESFSILTDDPIPFVKKTGHDRSPVFLKPSAFDEWLGDEEKDSKTLVQFLRDNRADLDLGVEVDRPMKAGWEKRIPKE